MLGALLDSYLDCLPKGVWDPEGKEYTASDMHFDHFHENRLTSDFSNFVAAASYDPEMEDSGDHCFLVVSEAGDLDGIQI